MIRPAPENPEKAYYTLQEAADRLGIGRTSVWREVDEGRMRAKKFRRAIRIPAEELARYEAESDYEPGGTSW